MRLIWPQFFGGAVLVYLSVNVMFATLYWLGTDAIANAHGYADDFFFSVETLATVGYGAMSPATLYAHIVATAEIITGMRNPSHCARYAPSFRGRRRDPDAAATWRWPARASCRACGWRNPTRCRTTTAP